MDGDANTQKPNSPQLCVNGCGFFGNPLTHGLCSKCNRDRQAQQQAAPVQPAAAAAPVVAVAAPVAEPEAAAPMEEERRVQADTSRCFACSKKVGLLGFRCRCDYVFCSTHRYSDKHNCSFDYKKLAQTQLQKANPVVAGSKVQKI